jgi:hypothetical protein
MRLGWPFENFDPKTSIAPVHFQNLNEVAIRARAILHSRNSKEIEYAANIVSVMLDYYYTGKELYTRAKDFPEGMSIHETGSHVPIQGPLVQTLADKVSDELLDTYILKTEVEYLKQNINTYSLNHPELKNPTQEELFCAFALWCIADCHSKLEPIDVLATRDPKVESPGSLDPKEVVSAFASAGDLALLAMDAVCQAEKILDMRHAFEKSGGLVPEANNEWDELRTFIKLTPDKIETLSKKKTASMGGKARIDIYFPEKAEAIKYLLDNLDKFTAFSEAERAVTEALNLHNRDIRTVRGWLKPYWNK